MIKAVIFDIGGVFIHDPWEWMLLDAKDNIADTFHLSREDVLRIGSVLWKKYDCITRSDVPIREQEKEWWSNFLAALSGYPDNLTVEYLINETDKYLEPIEPQQIRELLDFLKNRGLVLGICSNNTDFWFAREWTKLGLKNYFPKQNIILSQQVGFNKSSPGSEMFKVLKENIGCEFQEMIFIDDRKHNLEFAAQCGIQGIYVPGQTTKDIRYLSDTLAKMIS